MKEALQICVQTCIMTKIINKTRTPNYITSNSLHVTDVNKPYYLYAIYQDNMQLMQ